MHHVTTCAAEGEIPRVRSSDCELIAKWQQMTRDGPLMENMSLLFLDLCRYLQRNLTLGA